MIYDLITLGCKVNEYESQYYKEQMEKLSGRQKEKGEQADVVIINTCTVTNTAAGKSRQKIRRAARENPDAAIVVVGCYAQTVEEEIRKEIPADLWIGAAHKNEIGPAVARLLARNNPDIALEELDDIVDFESMPIGVFEGQHRAFLKIQDGCNQYCAYCQIPLARGPERSQIPDEVVKTARALAEAGHLEIVLTGIHTGRYSFRNTNLADLLKRLLEEVDEKVCFRLSSIEITEVSDELLDLMEQNPRILPHLHIPVQSASNATLQRMKRPYTMEMFQDRLDEIRRRIPDISISTDVICGFPEESEAEFAETLKNLEEASFSFLHVFPYSRRKGTAADAMDGHIHPDIVKGRVQKLLDLSARLRQKDMARFDKLEVLVERPDSKEKDVYLGYSKQYHPVKIVSSKPLQGRVQVRVMDTDSGSYRAALEGEDYAFIENV